MAKSSPKKGGHLGHRDLQRTELARKFIAGEQLSSATVRKIYQSAEGDPSFHKTYKRDREALEAEGLHLIEIRSGTAKGFKLDEETSLTSVPSSKDEDFTVLGIMMRPLVEDPSTPNPYALGSAIARMALSSCGGPAPAKAEQLNCKPDVLHACAEAMQSRKPLAIKYESLGDQAPDWRVLRPYGIFTLEGNVYVVGERTKQNEPDAMRTYNLSRAREVRVEVDSPTYQVPRDFTLSNWPLKPFEIGRGKDATIYARRGDVDKLKANAPKRGKVTTKQGGAALWQGPVSNNRAAASWCIENGFLPLEPEELVSEWQTLLKEA